MLVLTDSDASTLPLPLVVEWQDATAHAVSTNLDLHPETLHFCFCLFALPLSLPVSQMLAHAQSIILFRAALPSGGVFPARAPLGDKRERGGEGGYSEGKQYMDL